MQITYEPYRDAAGDIAGFVVNGRDMTGKHVAEEELRRHGDRLEELVESRTEALHESEQRLVEETAATAAIVNELLAEEADDPETERQVLNACLAATGSKLGMIGVINEHGKFDTTTYNMESLNECAFPEAMAWDLTTGMTIRGIWGWPMVHGEPLVCNELAHHPDAVGQPDGHVPVDCFLGVPVKNGDEVTGMVAVANKEGGYSPADQETLERLVAIMTVSRRYRQALRTAKLTSAELERKVAARTFDLVTVNRELESFAYSVSHDLRAPLRAIDGFSRAFVEDHEESIDESGRQQLSRVRAGAQRMGKLIDDLLQISRLARVEMNKVKVDLGAMAETIVEELRNHDPQRQVDVDIATGLEVEGDPTLLRSMLENLLGNAWKFTSIRERGRIDFGTTEVDGGTAFFVRDNGAGFDMAYAEKLFGVFQRLHDSTEFPGTGVGLATVQRVVQRHGGRVWGESAVDEGTTFYFTLPAHYPRKGE